MKTFKDIISEVAEPTARREKAFKDKHVIQKIGHPLADEGQFTAKKTKRDKTKKASMHNGEDVAVYEEVEELDELSQETLRNYHAKAGADRLKAKAEVEKGMARKKFTPASAQKTADSYKRFQKRGKGMTTAANKMDEEKMSDAEMKKREDIVMGMKKSKADLKKRYGDRWKSVMYATATKNAMKEAVEVSHDRYMRSHGKKASGTGGWFFTHKSGHVNNLDDKKEVHFHQGSFSDAKKSAQKWAKEHGHSTVYVMESADPIVPLRGGVKMRVNPNGSIILQDKDPSGEQQLVVFGEKQTKSLISLIKGRKTVKGFKLGGSIRATRESNGAMYIVDDSTPQGRQMIVLEPTAANSIPPIIYKRTGMSESTDLNEDITKMSHGRLKWHMNTGVPHGSYTKDEMKKERDRRLSRVDTHAAYKKAKAGLSEEYMDEAFKAGSMKLADGSSVKVTTEQANILNSLFQELNSSNKKKMEERLMSGSKGFNEILSFAKEAL